MPRALRTSAIAALAIAGVAAGAAGASAATFPFGPPVTVPMTYPNAPSLALDGSGATYLVSGEGRQLVIRPRGGAFAPAIDLIPGEPRPAQPQLGVSESGEVVMAFTRSSALGHKAYRRVKVVIRSADGKISTPRTISTLGHTAANPAVAVNARGDAIGAWLRYTGSGGRWQLQTATRLAGQPTFGTTITISLDDRLARGTPVSVAIGRDGTGYVAWRPGTSRESRPVRITTLTRTPTSDVTTQTLDDAHAPSSYGVSGVPVRLAVGADGTAAAIWIAQGSNEFGGDVKVAVRAARARSFGAPERVAAARGPVLGWDVGVAGTGTVTALWANYDEIGADADPSIHSHAFVKVRPAGGRFGAERRVSSEGRSVSAEGGGLGRTLDLAVDDAGGAVAAWASAKTYSGDAQIEVAVRRAGKAFGAPVFVSPASTRAFGPAVAIDRLGDLAVTWDALPGPGSGEMRGAVAFGSLTG